MTRAEYVEICRQCKNRGFDPNIGVTCSLTSKIADFTGACQAYLKDESVAPPIPYIEDNELEAIQQIKDPAIVEKLRFNQNFNFAITGGILATLVCSLGWAFITVATEHQIGYMAIGLGMIVGYAVRFFGAGIDLKYNILGAVLSLTGCILGNLLSVVGFIGNEYEVSYLQVLTVLDFSNISEIMVDTFQLMDVIFYSIACVFGFKFATIPISKEILDKLRKDEVDISEALRLKYRVPMVVISGVIIMFIAYLLISS